MITLYDALANARFLCPASTSSGFRSALSRTTYKYRYDGNLSDISPPGYHCAYQAAELPLLFGTAGEYHGAPTSYEDVVSRNPQDFWLEFREGSRARAFNAGWGPYADGEAAPLGGTVSPMEELAISQLEGLCNRALVSN